MAKTKTCINPNCQQSNPQPIENFGKNKTKKDGLQSWCKSCFSEYIKDYAKTDKGHEVRKQAKRRYVQSLHGKEKIKQYNAEYYQRHRESLLRPPNTKPLSNTPKNKSLRKFFRTEKGRIARNRYRNNPANKDQIRAAQVINNAVRDKLLPHISTQSCSLCDNQAEQYHHHKGYEEEYWLDVVPMCRKCHMKLHATQS